MLLVHCNWNMSQESGRYKGEKKQWGHGGTKWDWSREYFNQSIHPSLQYLKDCSEGWEICQQYIFIPFISGHKAEESAHSLPESVLKHQRGAQHHSRNKYKILCHPIRGKKTLAFFPGTSGKCFTHCFDVSHPFCWTDQQQILINLTSKWEHAHSEFRLPLLIKLHPCTLCLASWNCPLQKQSSIICKLFKHNI